MRVTKKHRADLLGSVWLFEQCSNRELHVLQEAATEMQFPTGKTLTKQGELGRHFMVIVEGEVEVTRDARRSPGSARGRSLVRCPCSMASRERPRPRPSSRPTSS